MKPNDTIRIVEFDDGTEAVQIKDVKDGGWIDAPFMTAEMLGAATGRYDYQRLKASDL